MKDKKEEEKIIVIMVNGDHNELARALQTNCQRTIDTIDKESKKVKLKE